MKLEAELIDKKLNPNTPMGTQKQTVGVVGGKLTSNLEQKIENQSLIIIMYF
ncbi:MAG: hypothetical protein O6940_05515 [Ignavibacteria bacterium]|nr:hypothetical protein [Ignavibacteria bacterium]